MFSGASTVTPIFEGHVEFLFSRARDVLGPSDELARIEQSGADVSILRRYLIDYLRAEDVDRDTVDAIAKLLLRVDVHRRSQVRSQVETYSEQFGALSSVARAIGAATPAELARTVTNELCGPLGYRKAMFSVVTGSSWSPASVSMQPDLEPLFGELATAVDGHRIELRDAPREAELVRKRRPYVLDRIDTYRHTYRPLIDLSRPSGYLAVPVVIAGKARGIIHVDRHEQGLTDADLRMVGALASVCALSCERAELRASLGARHTHIEERLAHLTRTLRDLDSAGANFGGASPEPGHEIETALDSRPTYNSHPSAPSHPSALSHREWEVLERLAAGETNASISKALCISDGTVKSHVQRIFRKIDVSTRAEAAAFVARRRVNLREH